MGKEKTNTQIHTVEVIIEDKEENILETIKEIQEVIPNIKRIEEKVQGKELNNSYILFGH